MMRRFLIDTDTASDDAVAILMALRWPDVQVDAVTIVAGNVPAEQGAKNAGYTVELCGKDTPVYIGCPRPLLRQPSWAYFFHGQDGMGIKTIPRPSARLKPSMPWMH
jgi:purine nucleosidase